MNIKFADTTLTDKFEKEVEMILEAMGFKQAITTDLSQFYDFTTDPALAADEESKALIEIYNSSLMEAVRTLCGTEHIREQDTIVFAAETLHRKLNGS